jgi:hypothetical protein
MTEKNKKVTGSIVTLILSFLILTLFYGNLFDQLNNVSFASGGDGLQSYINMEYHIKYDTSYMRCNSMNYPYGEHVFFTNNQPLFSNTVKFISENFVDISPYTLGMLNFLMLFSLVITPVIIFLIFLRLKVGMIISVIASLGIAYLSPQLDRFGGHFNLSYVFAIPWMILLLMKFFTKPTWLVSLLIFLTMLAGAATHFYLYGFFALLMIFFYGAELLNHRFAFRNKLNLAVHLFIQLILPYLILQAFYLSDNVTDRPEYPWGFLYYRAYPQSIFLPFGRPYGQFLYSIIRIDFIDWEGYAYVGLTAFAGTLFFLFVLAGKLVKKKFRQITNISGDSQLNILFWASLTGLLFSFGLPFILGLEWLIDLIGPVRQMRGIARFAWPFFYVMNILTIYWLWSWLKSKERNLTAAAVIILALTMLFTDAYYNVRNRGKNLANYIPALNDRELKHPDNQWIKRINLQQYQAIIPLPYFHIGSENIWLDGNCDIVNKIFLSVKNSGLPSMAALLSRTSINQTIDNVSAVTSPTCDNLNLKRYPSEKPFILMVARCDLKYWHEKELIRHAQWIDSSGAFDLFELPFMAFRKIQDSLNAAINNEYNSLSLYDHQFILSTDSLKNYMYLNFEELKNNNSLFGNGCLSGTAKNNMELYSGRLPAADTSRSYYLSFWMNNIRNDLYPRTTITLTEIDSVGNPVNRISFPVSKQIMQVSGNRALIEYGFRMIDNSNQIVIHARNRILRNKEVLFDNILLRPESTDLYYIESKYTWKNNYYYCR